MSQFWIANSKETSEQFIEFARTLYKKEHYVMWRWNTGKQRSELQNNAMHLYCEQLAEALNDAGYDFMQVMNTEADIPWSKESAKEFLWRPIQKSITGKTSTTRPTRDEYPKIYDALNNHLATKFGVGVPWPVKREDK